MNRIRPASWSTMLWLIVAAVAITSATQLAIAQSAPPGAPPRRIAIFGSSVAAGTGDELKQEGYTGRLRALLAPAGWEVLNQSRGGDNTLTMAPRFAPPTDGPPNPAIKYLLPVNPSYVVIGLSLGNEGIANVKTVAEKDSIFAQFAKGIKSFIDRSREHHIVPVVSLCYTRMDFTAVEYAYTRRMNLLINSWDVPSVNFLGAVDDGTGKWANGFWFDTLHPTAEGHTELTMTFVPSLFEALERGKPIPTKSTAPGFARVTGGSAPLTFTPTSPMHPFAVALMVRARTDGTILTVSGTTLDSTTVPAPPARGGAASIRVVTTLHSGRPFTASVKINNGVWTYTGSNGATVTSTVRADTAWHQLVVSHYTARGETIFSVDGTAAGSVKERLAPAQFVIGGPGTTGGAAPKQADYKDAFIYRSALNSDEVSALHSGTLLQASLELYTPLRDVTFARTTWPENRAQSTAQLKVGDGAIAHIQP